MTDAGRDLPHAIVVGASSGLGYAIAERLSGSHRVTALARRIERLAPLEERNILPVACDVTQLDNIPSLVEAAVTKHGKLSKIVYCAGHQLIKPMRALKISEIQDTITVNLMAAIVFGRLFASQKVTESDAVFCAISSIAARRPEPGIIPYAIAKAGLEALIKGLARECGPRRAIGIAPGWLDTEMTRSFPQIYNDAFRERLLKESPSGIATTDAVADLAIFLMSDQCLHLTGQIITIDGGASL